MHENPLFTTQRECKEMTMKPSNRPVDLGILMFFSIWLLQLTGCATSGDPAKTIKHPNPVLPEWASSPHIEGGMAITQCVAANGPMSILKGKAEQLARASLASTLKTRLEDLKVNYQQSDDSHAGAGFSEQYDRVSKSLLNQTLTGSRPARADYVTVDGNKEFCVMVTIDKTNTDRLREEVFSRAGIEANADQEQQLWQKFLLEKTEKSLEAERQRQ
jgi:hypothetical protein